MTSVFRVLVQLQWALIVLAPGGALAQTTDDLQLLYPDSSVSSRPIMEFRYRSTDLKNKTLTHAFVVLGRELDNGTTVFIGAAGFYPQGADNKLQEFRNVLQSPGHVDYKIADMHSDGAFRVRITGEQENAVKYLINNWNAKEYKIAEQNCTSLVKSVGKVLGLDTGVDGALEFLPAELIKHLAMENDPDKPLRYALVEWQRGAEKLKSQRRQMKQIEQQMIKHAQEVAQSQAEWQSWQNMHNQWSLEYNGNLPPTKVIEPQTNIFPQDNPLSAFWPWPPPSPVQTELTQPQPSPQMTKP